MQRSFVMTQSTSSIKCHREKAKSRRIRIENISYTSLFSFPTLKPVTCLRCPFRNVALHVAALLLRQQQSRQVRVRFSDQPHPGRCFGRCGNDLTLAKNQGHDEKSCECVWRGIAFHCLPQST